MLWMSTSIFSVGIPRGLWAIISGVHFVNFKSFAEVHGKKYGNVTRPETNIAPENRPSHKNGLYPA